MNKNDVTSGIDNKNFETIQNSVLNYLENKYGKHFQCVAHENASMLKEYYTFIFSETGKVGSQYEFKAYYYPNSDIKYRDSFYGLILRDLIYDEICSNTGFKSSDFKAFIKFRSTYFSNELTINSSIDDAVKTENKIDSVIYLFMVKNLDTNSIITEIKNMGVFGKVYFYVIDENTFSTLTYETYQEVISNIISNNLNTVSKGEITID